MIIITVRVSYDHRVLSESLRGTEAVLGEDVLRSLGIEPTDLSERRSRMVEAGQVLAGERLTGVSRDGQVQATVDGTGVLLGLAISDRPRRGEDAPALDAAILEAVRGAKTRAAMAARTGVAGALGISEAGASAGQAVEVPRVPEAGLLAAQAVEVARALEEHHQHPVARQEDEDEEVSFEEIDFVHESSDRGQAW